MRIKAQILKDYCFSHSTATTITKAKSYDWNSFLVGIRASQLATGLSSIYELAIEQHGLTCRCCSRIPKESVTCPTTTEIQQRRHTPGRLRIHREVGI